MDFEYKKINNNQLFESITDILNITNLQNYIPLYEKFFTLNNNNYNQINLDNCFSLHSITEKITNNKFTGSVIDKSGNVQTKSIFFKFCPLLDSTKYVVGKYDITNLSLLNLPQFQSEDCHEKVRDPNNSAYIDGFFTYLTSQILHKHGFIHGIDFYGSFLGKKNDFTVNIHDDLEYISNSDFFYKNNSKLFTISSDFHNDLINFDTRNYKKRIEITGESPHLTLSDISDLDQLETIFSTNNNESNLEAKLEFEYKLPVSSHKTSSTCSSRSSNTDNSIVSSIATENDSCSTASADQVHITINNFPVQVISLECCDLTLDSLILENDLNDSEWGSIVIQILMMLLTYQKFFNVTHNDLHTNNIMYISTDKQYLYYKYNGQHYKVPTFGKIFKIIDFGRAIYRFRGNVICSDSFHVQGDAATQYNFEPYLNPDKPRLEPNYSFDLCRLGCSLFDFIINDLDDIDNLTGIKKIIADWCKDDKGRNLLYKKNGEERYPDFKLYKMIARSCHKHTPLAVLSLPYFDRYFFSKKGRKLKIMNIDLYPSYI